MSVSDRVIAISVGAFAAVAYLVAGAGLATDYDYFGRLAAAFLAGHWWLDEAPSRLNELIAGGDGRGCVDRLRGRGLPRSGARRAAGARGRPPRGRRARAPSRGGGDAGPRAPARAPRGTLVSPRARGHGPGGPAVRPRVRRLQPAALGHALRRRGRTPHRGRCLLHAGPLLAALPAPTARRAVPRAARHRPGRAVLPHPALRRHEPLPHDTGVPVDLSRAARGAPRRGRGGDGSRGARRPPPGPAPWDRRLPAVRLSLLDRRPAIPRGARDQR